MAKITFENKVALNVNSDIADVNKCNATDLNEIKEVVNTNDDNTTTNTNNIANNTTSIGNLSSLNTTSKNNLVSAINEVNNNYKAYILYENANGVSSGTINLSDSFKNYERIVVATNLGGDKSLTPQYQSVISISTTEFYDVLYQSYLVATFSETTLTINRNGNYYSNVDHPGSGKIYKIIGYK